MNPAPELQHGDRVLVCYETQFGSAAWHMTRLNMVKAVAIPAGVAAADLLAAPASPAADVEPVGTTLRRVIRDLHEEAFFLAPVGIADPIEISHDDGVRAEALRRYAERLDNHLALAAPAAQPATVDDSTGADEAERILNQIETETDRVRRQREIKCGSCSQNEQVDHLKGNVRALAATARRYKRERDDCATKCDALTIERDQYRDETEQGGGEVEGLRAESERWVRRWETSKLAIKRLRHQRDAERFSATRLRAVLTAAQSRAEKAERELGEAHKKIERLNEFINPWRIIDDSQFYSALLDRVGFVDGAETSADGSAQNDLAAVRADAVMEFIALARKSTLPRKLIVGRRTNDGGEAGTLERCHQCDGQGVQFRPDTADTAARHSLPWERWGHARDILDEPEGEGEEDAAREEPDENPALDMHAAAAVVLEHCYGAAQVVEPWAKQQAHNAVATIVAKGLLHVAATPAEPDEALLEQLREDVLSQCEGTEDCEALRHVEGCAANVARAYAEGGPVAQAAQLLHNSMCPGPACGDHCWDEARSLAEAGLLADRPEVPDWQTVANTLHEVDCGWNCEGHGILQVVWDAKYRRMADAVLTLWNGRVPDVPVADEPRVFRAGDPEPSDHPPVTDRDGDVWTWDESDQHWLWRPDPDRPHMGRYPWHDLVSHRQPLTEATKEGEA